MPAQDIPEKDKHAETPTQISRRGWWQVLRRTYKESNDDNASVLAAAMAYYSFLSLFPALIAAISIYGLVLRDPETVASQIEGLTANLPEDAAGVITPQIESLASQPAGSLSFSVVISALLALWSASGATAVLLKALNIVYDEDESRGFVKTRALALGLTLGGIVFLFVSLALVAALPPLINALDLGLAGTIGLQVLRVAVLLVVVLVALGVLYRIGPSRADPKVSWVTTGAVVAAVLWLLFGVAFSIYVARFGSYNETYGAAAGVAILLLFFYVTYYLVLLGAELNAETERQTLEDTTTGPEKPVGERDAYVADEKPSHADDRPGGGEQAPADGAATARR